jgi:glycosyltransferase involved in cell wall biosynthesis
MKLSLIVPVYNEQEAIPIFYDAVKKAEAQWKARFSTLTSCEINFINDGSKDRTESIIKELERSDSDVRDLSFTRNFGKEAALFCGIEHCTGDIVIPIDVDLQDPLDLIPEMIEKHLEGADVVLAKRVDRSSDSFCKRKTAEIFYAVHNSISTPKLEPNVGDFRLISRSVVENIKRLHEKNLFMKGILSWPGCNKLAIVEYTREPRSAGSTKFNGWKLWTLALEGFTNFSTMPLKISTYAGAFISFVAFIYASILIFNKLVFGNPVSGYPSIMVSILFLGGIQLIGIGILGEYIGRIYTEVKNRPLYILKTDPGKSPK